VRTWDAATGKEVAAGRQLANKLGNLPIISPDGQRIVTLKFPRQVHVVYLATGKLALPVLKHLAVVINAAFSRDGKRLATACADGAVHIWDAKTGEPLTASFTHGPFLDNLGFSRDGRLLVTSGSDGTARVWDPETGQALTLLLSQAEPISGASFTPDGDHLATVTKGGTVRIWDIRPDSRPIEDLLLLARFLSGQQMDAASGIFVPFDRGNLLQSWPELRARFPAEFGPD
jgi:WD40 repeat protein